MNIRLPNITGHTSEEQIAQIRSYLYQLVPQLQIALGDFAQDVAAVSEQSRQGGDPLFAMPSGTAAQSTFNAMKPYIIQSTDVFASYYEKTVEKLPDTVAENGNVNGWSYSLQKSGRLEAHGVFELLLTSSPEPYGGLFRTEAFAVKLPFPLKSTVAVCTGEDVIASIAASGDDDSLSIRLYLAETADIGTKYKASILIHATKKEDKS